MLLSFLITLSPFPGLRGVKRELLSSLTKCGTQECINVMEDYKIGRLDTNGIDYNSVS